MKLIPSFPLFVSVGCLIPFIGAAQTPSERPLAADRPDSTESPFTVPKGRIQIESSLASFTFDDPHDGDSESWVFGETNFKFGLTPNTDLQLVVTPYLYERDSDGGSLTETSGFGDLTLRFKWNLWGNDSGRTALALLPYLKIPVETEVGNGRWEGGLIIPFACDLSDDVSLGLQVEAGSAFDHDQGRHWQFGHTAVLGFSLTETFGLYLEYAGTAGEGPYTAFASSGLTCLLHENLQLDCGALIGLNRHSSDLTLFSGFTVRY